MDFLPEAKAIGGTELHVGLSRSAQPADDGRPLVVLSVGKTRQQMSVVQALGFDVLVTGNCQWRPGDRLVNRTHFGAENGPTWETI